MACHVYDDDPTDLDYAFYDAFGLLTGYVASSGGLPSVSLWYKGQSGAETAWFGGTNFGPMGSSVPLSYFPGLILMGYRWYNPSIGRFWTRDPQGYDGGINLYAFCRNNPVNHSDPEGLQVNETTHVVENTTAYVSSAVAKEQAGEVVATQVAKSTASVASRSMLRVGGSLLGRVAGPVSILFFLKDVHDGAQSLADLYLSYIQTSPEEVEADQPLGARRRTFRSSDPLVADIANAIERKYPRLVVGVNRDLGGHEIDILLRNAIIEVKAGGKGLTKQIEARKGLGLPVIGYSPDLGKHAIKSINAAGGIGTNNLNTLMAIIKPVKRR